MPELEPSDNQSGLQRRCQHFVLPDAELWLWREWLPAAHCAFLFEQIAPELPWQQPSILIYGKSVAIPRQQVWMGDPHCHYQYSGVQFRPEPWHPAIQQLLLWVNQQLNRTFNAVLINWYQDGQQHMGWHSDDEPELGAAPDIASLSLGETRRFDLRHIHAEHQLQLSLGQGDLLLMGAPCQQFWQHRVPKQSKVSGARMNFTFRYISPDRPK